MADYQIGVMFLLFEYWIKENYTYLGQDPYNESNIIRFSNEQYKNWKSIERKERFKKWISKDENRNTLITAAAVLFTALLIFILEKFT